MWESIVALGPESNRLNISWAFEVNTPLRVPEALVRIERCLARLDIFRVAFDEQRMEQTFQGKSVVGVHVTDAHIAELRTKAFGIGDVPIRVELIREKGLVTYVAVVLSHLTFDGGVYYPLMRRLRDAVEGREPSAASIQTEELIRYERSAEGVRKSDAIIDRWVRAARRLPPGRGLMPTTAGTYSVVAIRSRALAIAAQVLAVRSGVTVSGIVLAALTKMARRHVEPQLSAILLVSNNRMQPRLLDFVGQTLGNGLLLLPNGNSGEAFLSYAKVIYSRAIAAYLHARYDCVRWRHVLAGLSARGQAADLSYYFNDVRIERDSWLGLEDRATELRQGVRQETSVEVVERREMSDATFFANLDSVGQECLIKLVTDDNRIPPEDAVALLTALEDLLVEEALAS
ncbi:hypothetical protein [Streptomyces sp. BK205]|uniref:hypothetical protein n=1 Tax=Streptomyces sp. BK205 TaxID=2512164 RepID=UPI00104E48C5|nr:hypothetical protein [Streptomyces sp. BK205]